ncbi:MAG: hypothetical protein ACP5D1_01290 [Bacteroidales bacterium]
MNKLYYLFFPFLLLCFGISFSQAPFPTPEEAGRIPQITTMVVLENDMFSSYNIYVKDAMEKHWKLTPFEFISTAEFENLRKDPDYGFLVLTGTSFEQDKGHVYYNFLNFLLGKDVREIEEMPELCSFPLSYSEADEEEYVYKLELVIRFMQQHAEMILKDPSVTALQFLTYYNKNTSELVDKTLLLEADDLAEDVNTEEEIRELIDHTFRIVARDEIEAAIAEKRPHTVILHKVGPENTSNTGRTYKVLIGCDDARVYYFNYHTINRRNSDGFLKSDFRRIGRY